MTEEAVIAIAALLFAYSVYARPLHHALLSGPIVFLALGIVLGPLGVHWIDADAHELVYIVAEVTLIIILFEDASLLRLERFREQNEFAHLAGRLLLVALPLIILAGTLVGKGLFPEFLWQEALVLAVVLAPTDAALCEPVFASKQMPQPVQEALNTDSGLNDGVCLPILLFALALSVLGLDMQFWDRWLHFISLQLILGPLAGAAIGWLGALLVRSALRRHWVEGHLRGMAVLGLAALSFFAAEYIGGNGFIAAFVAGLTFGNGLSREDIEPIRRFSKAEGQLLVLATFTLFGAIAFPHFIEDLQWRHALYAVLSLTVIRMIPVALAFIGTNTTIWTRLFLGWFGPRGVASILYLFLVLEKEGFMEPTRLPPAVALTVVLSVILHGVTAEPATRWYAQALARSGKRY
ncbi:MAG: cation:proton antiporter [Geminicoccaceae bacterium]